MFSERLRKERESRQLSQKAFSEIIGVAQPTYALYETGKRQPDFDTLVKIIDYFHITADYLLGLTEYSEHSVTFTESINNRFGSVINKAKLFSNEAAIYFMLDKVVSLLDVLITYYQEEDYRDVVAIIEKLTDLLSEEDIKLSCSIEKKVTRLIDNFTNNPMKTELVFQDVVANAVRESVIADNSITEMLDEAVSSIQKRLRNIVNRDREIPGQMTMNDEGNAVISGKSTIVAPLIENEAAAAVSKIIDQAVTFSLNTTEASAVDTASTVVKTGKVEGDS